MDVQRLIAMANDIADYFVSEPDHEAGVAGVANHLRKFWDPRMRRQILAHFENGGSGLGELAREGVARLAETERQAARNE